MPKRGPREQGNAIVGFAREHPVLMVAGGVALGAVAAALLPRGTGRKLARRAVAFAEVASAAGAVIGNQAMEQAESAGASLRDHGAALADRIGKFGESAGDRIGHLSESAAARVERLREPVEDTAARLAKKASDLRSRVRS